jgi:thiamine pyrophosphate-dependent acetolactate synthase large subunit-like protein
MAIYNAWVDRVPILILAGNGLDASQAPPGHRVEPRGAGSGAAGARLPQVGRLPDVAARISRRSTVRAYKIATTPPMEPVLITADIDLQEEPIHEEDLKIPEAHALAPAQGDRAALAEAAKWLVAAEQPVIIATAGARTGGREAAGRAGRGAAGAGRGPGRAHEFPDDASAWPQRGAARAGARGRRGAAARGGDP